MSGWTAPDARCKETKIADIAFVQDPRWAPSPSIDMIEKLTALADTDETQQPLVSLDSIRQAARKAKQVQNPHEREMDENLLRWAEKYWKSQGYDDADAISMLIYY